MCYRIQSTPVEPRVYASITPYCWLAPSSCPTMVIVCTPHRVRDRHNTHTAKAARVSEHSGRRVCRRGRVPTCQYLAAQRSTQLFSPTLRSPSLYLHARPHTHRVHPLQSAWIVSSAAVLTRVRFVAQPAGLDGSRCSEPQLHQHAPCLGKVLVCRCFASQRTLCLP